MPWYDGMTNEEVEQAILDGTAPGVNSEFGGIEVPSRFLMTSNVIEVLHRRARIGEFHAKWREDSELIALAKESERTRIAGYLRAKAEEYGPGSDEWEVLLAAAERVQSGELDPNQPLV
jgi:hypothetical protein